MTEQDSFADVMQRLESGEEQAATEVFGRFVQRLARMANRRLQGRVRRTIDADDVVQSVFRTFFRRLDDGQFQFNGWDSLESLLVRITLRKCGRQTATLHATCRDIRREIAPGEQPQSLAETWEAITREPSPEEVAVFSETFERLINSLDSREQRMIMMRLEGHSIPEISSDVGLTERTIKRMMARARVWLEQIESAE